MSDASKGQNSNIRVWSEERLIFQEGANREDGSPSSLSNPSLESMEFRLLLGQEKKK